MNRKRMDGVYVVEFAIIGVLLFTLLIGVLDLGRLYFTVNGLNEVVRRGARLAAVCDIRDPVILRRAIFNAADDAGTSSLIGGLETADLALIYLDESGIVVPSPGDGGAGFSSIRFVQLSVNNFSFTTLIVPLVRLLSPGSEFSGFTLPTFRSTIPRESLGRHAEEPQPFDQPAGITPC